MGILVLFGLNVSMLEEHAGRACWRGFESGGTDRLIQKAVQVRKIVRHCANTNDGL